jgi:lipopolysaccharide/colanic/teichoic acid biosynthesis glycosyltransferase
MATVDSGRLGGAFRSPSARLTAAFLDRRLPYDRCQAVLEFAAALLLLLLGLPVLLLAAALVRLTTRGPALYRQTRLGRKGRLYTVYKLRTMFEDCERTTGPCWATPDDPRITPVGRFLRRWHLDELPQLWNVLRGEMGLIGPRPERPEFYPRLAHALPRYRDRLQIRPGVTGLAQVQLPPDSDLASVRCKLAYDLYYLRHRGPWLDMRLLLATALHLVGLAYEGVRSLLALPARRVVLEAYERFAGPPPGRLAAERTKPATEPPSGPLTPAPCPPLL